MANFETELRVPTKEEVEKEIGPAPETPMFKPFSEMTEEERAKIKQAVPNPRPEVVKSKYEKTE